MRISFLTSKINLVSAGGSVPDLDLKVRDMQIRGHEVRVITAFSKYNVLDRIFPYPILEESISPTSLLTTQYDVYKLLKKHETDTDIFHIEGQFCYGGGLYKKRGGKRTVAFYNRELISWPGAEGITWGMKPALRYMLERKIGTHIADVLDGHIFTSPALQHAYHQFGLKGEPSLILPDFVDDQAVRAQLPSELVQKETEATPLHQFTFITSGRMITEKGFHLVIQAAAHLPKSQPFHIIMCGNGPELANLQTLTEKLQLSDKITFPGWVDKKTLLHLLHTTDAFILPRWRTELTSVILLEAMSVSTPCIVPSGGGLEWLAGPAALTFKEGDPETLSQTMILLMHNPEKRNSLIHGAKEQMEQWNHHRMAIQLEKFIIGK